MGETSLHHDSQRYFSIVFVQDDVKETIMIDQPEVGILGFVTAGRKDKLRWLVQKKSEPGNVGYSQWAPTVQATKSNYERVHGGRCTPFLELFLDPSSGAEDRLGSEQGSKFLNKFNRNAHRHLKKVTPLPNDEEFCWVSSETLRQALCTDFAVNTDARSVIAITAWNILAPDPSRAFLQGSLPPHIAKAFNSSYRAAATSCNDRAREVLRRIQKNCPRAGQKLAISQLSQHELSDEGVYDGTGNRVLGFFDCRFANREVTHWQQPLLEQSVMGHCYLLFCVVEGVAFFRLAAYPELGFNERVEFGPSVQYGDTAYKASSMDILEIEREAEIFLEILQSDEGGRFFRDTSRYLLAQWHGDPRSLSPDNGCWFNLAELESLSQQERMFTNELRTLISLVLAAI